MPGLFEQLEKRTVRWVNLINGGIEHLTLEKLPGKIVATSVLIGGEGSQVFGAWYQIFMDARWRVKAVSIHATDTRWLILRSPRAGKWCDGDGKALPDLDGARYVWLPDSPFAIMPLVRCVDLGRNDVSGRPAVQVSIETLQPRLVELSVKRGEGGDSCLVESADGQCFRFKFDLNGLVNEQAEKFKRI